MGVYIEGARLPKNCEECNFKVECRPYWERMREQYTRPTWCPCCEWMPEEDEMTHGRERMKQWDEFVSERGMAVGYPTIINDHTRVEVACPKCGKAIYRNDSIILASNPPQRQYRCFECGWVGSSF